MRVDNRLLQKKEAVDRELERILSREDSVLFKAMRYAVLFGGKRFRPLLTLSSGECFGVSQETALPFACAVELIHNYSLIHDDLPAMDNDDFRRGKPSCHKAYGEDVALLAGDGLLTLAFEVLAQAAVDEGFEPRKERVIKEISRLAGVEGMIGGQLLDITLSPKKITEEQLNELILKKTGSLIIASVRAGAILGGAPELKLEAITEYGKNIGLAFQSRDDILDSAEDSPKDHFFRASSVSFLGLEEAERRMKQFVDMGIAALDENSIESDELRFLALKIKGLKERIADEKNT